jgi:hypothetical protein
MNGGGKVTIFLGVCAAVRCESTENQESRVTHATSADLEEDQTRL